ncbi:hypothetical protein [Nonomuraea dietziae]|uniref:hypothetical protein n=1 Tax=Nonomuraea dietziae TaxID=65515 RepID=UPI003402071A
MQKLALFDLDDTLVDRLDAFRRWVAEFTGRRGLSKQDAAWMIELDADGSLPTEEFFAAVHERFGVPEPVDMLWDAYRVRMPELVVCPRPVLRGLRRQQHHTDPSGGLGWVNGPASAVSSRVRPPSLPDPGGRPHHRSRDRQRHLRRPRHRAVGAGLHRGRPASRTPSRRLWRVALPTLA